MTKFKNIHTVYPEERVWARCALSAQGSERKPVMLACGSTSVCRALWDDVCTFSPACQRLHNTNDSRSFLRFLKRRYERICTKGCWLLYSQNMSPDNRVSTVSKCVLYN